MNSGTVTAKESANIVYVLIDSNGFSANSKMLYSDNGDKISYNSKVPDQCIHRIQIDFEGVLV